MCFFFLNQLHKFHTSYQRKYVHTCWQVLFGVACVVLKLLVDVPALELFWWNMKKGEQFAVFTIDWNVTGLTLWHFIVKGEKNLLCLKNTVCNYKLPEWICMTYCSAPGENKHKNTDENSPVYKGAWFPLADCVCWHHHQFHHQHASCKKSRLFCCYKEIWLKVYFGESSLLVRTNNHRHL